MFKKMVRFDRATIYLVSKIKDNAECDLWWSNADVAEAKKGFFRELERMRLIHGRNITISDAFKLLYQPNNITYNEENFRY